MGTGESRHRRRTESHSQPVTHSQDRETRVRMYLIPPFKNTGECHRGVGVTRLVAQLAQLGWPVDDYNPISSLNIYSRQVSQNDEDISLCVIYEVGTFRYLSNTKRLIHMSLAQKDFPTGVMFVYDITRHETWEDCKIMIQEALAKNSLLLEAMRRRIMIMGCKCDLVKEREVEIAAVKNYADENGLLFIETSAKEDINVDYAFISFATQLLETCRVKGNS